MRRLLPDGIVGRLALAVIVLVTLSAVSYWWLYGRDRDRESLARIADATAGRISAVTTLVERSPAAEHETILSAVRSHHFRVRHSDAAPPQLRGYDDVPGAAQFRDALTTALTHHGVVFAPLQLVKMPRRDHGKPHLPRHWARIAVATEKSGQLVFHVAVDVRRIHSSTRRLIGLCMLGLFLIALLIWAAHRETKPLRRFTAAADRLGLDMNAPPLEEVGSRELRTAAGAFNRMQARLQRFVADRTQMLAAISHDLRTPLTRLRLRAEFIDDEKQQSKAIADIDEMQAMISQALTFARDDAQTEARETLDIAQLLRTLCSNLRDSGHRATFHGEQSVPFVCQPIALRRALSNLAENAVRYGEQADVTLSADAQSVTITVEDIGPGIPTSEHEAVFSPFYRLEQSRNRETGGVGLGLSLARGIIRRHGGDIALHPRTPGPGLRVEVSLPMS